MNGKKAKLLRKKAKSIRDQDTTYDKEPKPAGRTTIAKRMEAFRAGLIEDTSKIGEPSITLKISPKSTRYYYHMLKENRVPLTND